MKGLFFGIFLAICAHGALMLFGNMPFKGLGHKPKIQQVELVTEAVEEQKEKKEPEPEEEKAEEVNTGDEPPPDASEIIRNMEMSANEAAPELEAASLSAIEAALSGLNSGGGDFAESLSFQSGGRIGGKGKAGGMAKDVEDAFSQSEIDQKPRAIYQAAPVYPSTLRGIEGTVTLIFVVDEGGRVINPRVEKSTNPEFERPALEAIRQWRFEPGARGGKKVASKMRIPIKFQPKQ